MGDDISTPMAVSDGSNGAIVSWLMRSGGGMALFATRVTAGGGLPWRTPVRVSGTGLDVRQPVTIEVDGDALFAWIDSPAPAYDVLRGQRVTHGGKLAWPAAGLPLCDALGTRGLPGLIPDGTGGAFLAWSDSRERGGVIALRIDKDGRAAPGWSSGIVIHRRAADPDVTEPVRKVLTVRGGPGRAIVVWEDLQRNFPGGLLWPLYGAMLLTPAGPAAVPDAAPRIAPVADEVQGHTGATAGMAFGLTAELDRTTGATFVRASLARDTPATLELFDVAGRRVLTHPLAAVAGEERVRVDGLVPPGWYAARVRQGDRTATARVIVVGR
jgi:hypothetical protein